MNGYARVLGFLGLLWAASVGNARGQTPAEFAQTAAFAASHQNKDGGFSETPGEPSTLGATNAGLRVLKHVGGSTPDVLGCIRFVKSCRDAGGGFASTPGGKPDPVVTAVGLMAAAELKIADPDMIKAATEYMGANAKTFEQIRMAIAGLEAVGAKSPDFPRWSELFQSMKNAVGTYGEGDELAFTTGGVAASILRMGKTLEDHAKIAAALKDAQGFDGAWSRGKGPSDLGSTYRILRALYMMNETPRVEPLLAYIAARRQSDGGYAMAPGGKSSLGSSYLATIAIRWLRLLTGRQPVVETAGFTALASDPSLADWQGEKQYWSVKNGVLTGESPGLGHNTFLASTRTYGDFVLAMEFRLKDGQGNSGVQFRSVLAPPHEMSGYQADIGEGYWGSLYDESRRNKTLVAPRPAALKNLRKSEWNRYIVRAMGDHINISLAGATTVDYREPDPKIARDGLIATQIHAGGPMRIEFSNLMIQPLPTPSTESTGSAGFHLKSLATPEGERKYTLYTPEGYDGKTPMPLILFLHGAGERGQDGVVPAQVGLGPAVLSRGGVSAFVLFPQARRTWSADSPDMKAALLALDEVTSQYKIDPKRIILTGLSMGGHGSWDLAVNQPDRFAACVPICGPGQVDQLEKLRSLPVWAFCGDDDRVQTLHNMRAMVEGLLAKGGQARLTEYRGVGHNSWDRAYNDPALIDWMLKARRP